MHSERMINRSIMVWTIIFVLSSICIGHSISDQMAIPTNSNQHQHHHKHNYYHHVDELSDVQLSQLISRNILQMAHDIGSNIIQDSIEKTQIFSPLSIYGALSMLLLGANGLTFNELMHFLHYNSKNNDLNLNSWKIHKEFGNLLQHLDSRKDGNEDEHKIRVANRIFVQQDFQIDPDYYNGVKDVYGSNTTNLDFVRDPFGATAFINSWIKNVTDGKIQEILSHTLNTQTRLVITSALHFKAMWEKTFIQGATSKRQFYPNGLSEPSIMVDMMAQGGTFPFYDAVEYNCRIIGLPYKRNESTMYIILPNNSSKLQLQQLQSQLSADSIRQMIRKMEPKTTVMLFPKLHISNEYNLKRVLRQLGVYSLFERSNSDLSLIANSPSIPSSTQQQTTFNDSPDSISNQFPQLTNTVAASQFQSVSFNLNDQLIFSRLGEDSSETTTTKATNQTKHTKRTKRNINNLKNLDRMRQTHVDGESLNPGLFAEDIIHKIDLTVNEMGTDGGAATVTYLYRSGTDVIFRVETPFMLLIQHDHTGLPLFYGTVFEPINSIT